MKQYLVWKRRFNHTICVRLQERLFRLVFVLQFFQRAKKMLICVPALAILLLATLAASSQPVFRWVKSLGEVGVGASVSVVTDSAGNVYTTGLFSGTVDFDPGPNVFNLVSEGGMSIFISKVDAAGSFLWVKQLAGPMTINTTYRNSIALDSFGNVFTTGAFTGTGDFDPGPGIFTLVGLTYYENLFITKLDTAGNFRWAKMIGGGGSVTSQCIAVTAPGEVYTTGYFSTYGSGSPVDFDPGPDIYNITNSGTVDAFILKLDSSGNFAWAKKIPRLGVGETGYYGFSTAVDRGGYVYAIGTYWADSPFSPNPSKGNYYTFIYKWNTAGDLIWTKRSSYPASSFASNVVGQSISIDPFGNLFIAGYGADNMKFRTAADAAFYLGVTSVVFLAKLDSSGNSRWLKSIGSNIPSVDARGYSVVTDKSGNAYVTGLVGPKSDSKTDAYCYKWDSAGNLKWSIPILDGSSISNSVALAIDDSGSIFTTGTITGGGNGSSKIAFLLKIGQAPVAPLPVSLLQFRVTQSGTVNHIHWQTAQEQNSSSFAIERSTDGTVFHNIGVVAASGTSTVPKDYAFTDAQPHPGTSFYRLKMTDHDGSYTYSKIIAVSRDETTALKLFPNPVKDVLQVWTAVDGPTLLHIADAAGRILKQQNMALQGHDLFVVDVHQLPKGEYFLLLLQNGRKEVKAFLKQ